MTGRYTEATLHTELRWIKPPFTSRRGLSATSIFILKLSSLPMREIAELRNRNEISSSLAARGSSRRLAAERLEPRPRISGSDCLSV